MVVIIGSNRRVRVISRHPARNLVADRLSQTIVVVSLVVDWQQPPVLGIEHKQQPIEKDQRRIPALSETSPRFLRKRIDEVGKHPLEHHPRKILRNLFLIAPTLSQRLFKERSRGPVPERERLAAEQQMKNAKVVFLAGLEQFCQVGFKETTGAWPGTIVVQSPDAAISENAPTNVPLRLDLSRRQVSKNLTMRCPTLRPVIPIPAVERKPKALALFNYCRVLEGILAACLGFGIREKQVIGNVFMSGSARLRHVLGPSQ